MKIGTLAKALFLAYMQGDLVIDEAVLRDLLTPEDAAASKTPRLFE